MLDRDFFLGFIKIHILYHASQSEIYGAWLIEELRRHGYHLSYGTLYPTLHHLEREGYLLSRVENVGGRRRKYYAITPKGEEALKEARARIRELVDEALEGAGGEAT